MPLKMASADAQAAVQKTRLGVHTLLLPQFDQFENMEVKGCLARMVLDKRVNQRTFLRLHFVE